MRTWDGVLRALLVLCCGIAHAAKPDGDVALQEGDAIDEAPPSSGATFALDPPSKLGIGLQGYAGIAAQITDGEGRAHGLVGGLARVRFHYFQVGGIFEITDSSQSAALGESHLERWRALGGFVGVVLPYHHWVDFDGSIGLSSRNYGNPDPIYGAGGLSRTLTALDFRVGVSARATQKLIGPRFGAALAVSADLSHAEPEWRREYAIAGGGTGVTTGTTPIGGVSIGLVVSAGFELGARSR